jgi:hypothetical protein
VLGHFPIVEALAAHDAPAAVFIPAWLVALAAVAVVCRQWAVAIAAVPRGGQP